MAVMEEYEIKYNHPHKKLPSKEEKRKEKLPFSDNLLSHCYINNLLLQTHARLKSNVFPKPFLRSVFSILKSFHFFVQILFLYKDIKLCS